MDIQCDTRNTSIAAKPSQSTGKSKVKVKSALGPILAHQAGAYPGFCSMKRLGVFLLPPGWDASLLQGYPQH